MQAADSELPWPRSGGLLLGRYELMGVIGRGGMGVVSKARDVRSGRLVAVKRVRSSDARAEREALAAARLKHPAIVELLEAEASDDGWIIVSELVVGADLRAVLRTGEVPELDIARFAGSIVRGLDHAHRHGVVHRDVKPANILCPADPRKAGAWAKLTDFGVAALQGAETLTAVGDVVGTMAYMAPEQARGNRAEAPADVFSLAVVVFEALSGVNPRRGSTAAETAARALSSMPPLARLRPDLPSGIHAALDHCLQLDPDHRGGLVELDEGLRRLAALASGGGGRPAPPAPTQVTRLDDRGGDRDRDRGGDHGGGERDRGRRAGPAPAAGFYDGLQPIKPGREPEPDQYADEHSYEHEGDDYPREGDDYPREAAAGRQQADGAGHTQIDPRRAGAPLVPYLPPPGHVPVGDPRARREAAGDLGPHGWAGDAVARPDGGELPYPQPAPSRGRFPRLPLRLLAAGGAASALAVLNDGASAPMALAAIGLAAFLIPRLTWVAITLATLVLLTSRDETAAALALLAGAAPIVLLPGRGVLWPASGLAAGLTAISAPLAWPALAALAPKANLRIALGVLGALVVSVVATATNVPLLDVPTGNFAHVVSVFVAPMAAIWGAAAFLLGAAVRGRTFGADLLIGLVWAGGLGAAMVGAKLADPEPLLWAGPVVAAGVVALARGIMRERQQPVMSSL
jgi:tRNA A-37 threonylcarbamoyl transferase component Bud32